MQRGAPGSPYPVTPSMTCPFHPHVSFFPNKLRSLSQSRASLQVLVLDNTDLRLTHLVGALTCVLCLKRLAGHTVCVGLAVDNTRWLCALGWTETENRDGSELYARLYAR